MAILSGGPNSGFSGKAGSVVGYFRKGKWVIRGLPKLSAKNKEGTAEQNFHRSRLSRLQHFLKQIVHVVRIGFHVESLKRGNTEHNAAMSWNLHNAFDENNELDYSKIRISSGELPGAEDPAVSVQDGKIVFTWRDNSEETYSRTLAPKVNDQLMILAYDVSPYAPIVIFKSGSAWRSAEIYSVELSKYDLGAKYHVWIAFNSDDRKNISNSQYLGIIQT